MTSLTVLIATGASGGHMFPALAVAEVLRERGVQCVFVVGGTKFAERVDQAGFAYEKLPASAFNVSNPVRKLKALINLGRAWLRALTLLNKYHPAAVFGTGGYATVATVLAAKVSGVPVVLHEQNVLPGRANRFLARMADVMAVTFESSRAYLNCRPEAVVGTGNPVRAELVAGLQQEQSHKGLNLLVIGGSQGARVLSDVVPETVARLSQTVRQKLTVHHQARPEDEARVTAGYQALALVEVRVEPFIEDMAAALRQADVVISRAGTGAVVENALAGKAAIYVPHPLADGHQLKNAQVAEEAGAAVVLEQSLFTPEVLLPHLTAILTDVDRRAQMVEAARELAKPEAAVKVADLVEKVAKADVMTMETES